MTRQFTWRNMEGYLTVTDELLKAAPSYPENVRRLIRQRIGLFLLCLRHYRPYVRMRTLMVLMLKKKEEGR